MTSRDIYLQIFWDIWHRRVRLRRWIPGRRRQALCPWTWSKTLAGNSVASTHMTH